MDTLEGIKRTLIDEKPASHVNCIQWARLHFEEQFCNQIKQLLYNFPPDQVTSSGAPFWSGPKRCPHPLVFDVKKDMHVDYILAAANLRAESYGLEQIRDRDYIIKELEKIRVAPFKPKEGREICT
ncbi:hypothetical protein BSL78_06817 [Apostichopus japonicus]|uniref:Ubiquitin-activating enzyme SCCH domain-containing protein n=1 Tax=Stichopus japonicus TaxID=307972 RepID=A0A2G8L7P4_STIJA|nr:hypothetical protein BSL78_06817 [Apostichopus japonicus]